MGLAGEGGAPGTQTDAGPGQGDPGSRDQADQFEHVDGFLAGEGRSLLGHQTVDRHTLRSGVKATEHLEHFQPVILVLSHAKDSPAANGHPRFLYGSDRAEPILERVGGHNIPVMFGGGVEIVVVGGDPGFLQLAGGLVGELA